MNSAWRVVVAITISISFAACCYSPALEAGSTSGTTGATTNGTSGGACTNELNASPLAFPVETAGECYGGRAIDGGSGLIVVAALLAAQPLVQDSFSCGSDGPLLTLDFGVWDSSGPTLVPGTYVVPRSVDGGQMDVTYSASLAGDFLLAQRGSVTFTTVTTSQLIGNFDVTFDLPDAGTQTVLSGTFCAPYFGSLSQPP